MEIYGHEEPHWVHVKTGKFPFDALDISLFFIVVKSMTREGGSRRLENQQICEAHTVSLHCKAEAGIKGQLTESYLN